MITSQTRNGPAALNRSGSSAPRSPISMWSVLVIGLVAFVGTAAIKRWNAQGTAVGATPAAAPASTGGTTADAASPPSATSPPATGSSQSPPATATRKRAPSTGRSPDDLVSTGFEIMHEMTRVGRDVADDAMGLSAAQELEIGRETHRQIRAQHKLLDADPRLARIVQLAEPFLKQRRRKDIPYTFSIIEDKTLNAFAHLGGFVYIHTGLLDLVRRDEELQFVIGHEIAHCDLRHCVRNMTIPVRAGELAGRQEIGSLAALAWKAVALGYSEDFEFESDRWSYRSLRRQGVSHDRALLGLRMLAEHTRGPAPEARRPRQPVLVKQLEDHFRSHPEINDRIAQLEKLRNQPDE